MRYRLYRLGLEQHFRLRDLLRYNLKMFARVCSRRLSSNSGTTTRPPEPASSFDEWCRQTMRSRIEPMKKIARSLRQHRELILNYFRAQKLISSGVATASTNKARVTVRKSSGFLTYRVQELALSRGGERAQQKQLFKDDTADRQSP